MSRRGCYSTVASRYGDRNLSLLRRRRPPSAAGSTNATVMKAVVASP